MVGLVVLAGAAGATWGGLWAFQSARDGVLANVQLAGVPVGGMEEPELREAVRAMAAERGARRIVVIRPALGTWGEDSVQGVAADLGYRLDVEATVQAVLGRGRQRNPLAALADHLVATFRPIRVRPVERVDPAALDGWVRGAVAGLTRQPREADLEFQGTSVRPVAPVPGAGVDGDALGAAVRAALLDPARDRVVAAARPLPPRTTAADLAGVLRQARRALSGPVRLTRAGTGLTFTPEELAGFLEVEVVGDGDRAGLRLAADPDRLAATVSPEELAAVETDPVDASFAVSGDRVRVVPSRKGFRFDPGRAAERVVEAATSRRREGRLTGERVEPELTTREARALGITERVSTFTTYHPCCQARVTNIHRIADLIRGTVVRPGEVFSVNAAVGERTVENGFVPAPAIRDGEFVEEVGGGISQFATTMFNAIYFGGYRILEHQAHSYWFTRYPMGREATVSWPGPDLRFRNDSGAGIYIHTSYTGESITVTFYGRRWVDVESVTGAPYNFRDPPTQCRANRSLKKGESRVVQEGSQGFDVVVRRILHFPGGRERTERYFTRYRPQPTIVERRSCP